MISTSHAFKRPEQSLHTFDRARELLKSIFLRSGLSKTPLLNSSFDHIYKHLNEQLNWDPVRYSCGAGLQEMKTIANQVQTSSHQSLYSIVSIANFFGKKIQSSFNYFFEWYFSVRINVFPNLGITLLSTQQ